MSLAEFIRQHREKLDREIRQCLNDPGLRLNDEQRRLWILNDYNLYLWARKEGVSI